MTSETPSDFLCTVRELRVLSSAEKTNDFILRRLLRNHAALLTQWAEFIDPPLSTSLDCPSDISTFLSPPAAYLALIQAHLRTKDMTLSQWKQLATILALGTILQFEQKGGCINGGSVLSGSDCTTSSSSSDNCDSSNITSDGDAVNAPGVPVIPNITSPVKGILVKEGRSTPGRSVRFSGKLEVRSFDREKRVRRSRSMYINGSPRLESESRIPPEIKEEGGLNISGEIEKGVEETGVEEKGGEVAADGAEPKPATKTEKTKHGWAKIASRVKRIIPQRPSE